MTGRILLLLVFASTFLAACVGEQFEESATARPLGLDFGNAIRHNEAVLVIDPSPATANEQAPALDGRRAAAAMARYQNGAVRELEIERTADSNSE